MLVNRNQVTHVSVSVVEGVVSGFAKFADGSIEQLTSVERARELQRQVQETAGSTNDNLLLG